MKGFIIITLFLIISQAILAQSSFFNTFKRPSHESTYSSIILSDSSYLLAGEMRQEGYFGTNEGYFAKLSQSGEIIKESLIFPGSTSRCMLLIPYAYEGADVLCIGSTDSVAGNDTYSRIIFLGLDSDLNIKYQKLFAYQKNYIKTPWQYSIRGDSILYLMCNNSKVNNGPGPDMYYSVTKYQFPFDSISTYNQQSISIGLDLIFNEPMNQLFVYYGVANYIAILDKDLNFIYGTENYNFFPSYVDVTGIADSDYLKVGCTVNHINSNLLIGCIRYNSNNISTDSLFYTPSTDTNFYSGARQSIAISGNSIFFCGIYNVHAFPFPYNYNPSWISVTKTDMNLNIISSHFYGGDAQYCPYSIIPTADGGCFLNGFSYDYQNNLPTGEYELDIFALKVNSDGLYTGLPGRPEVKAHDAILYPNPGREYATIQSGPQIKGAQFTLFDLLGRPVKNAIIENTQLHLNTAELLPGTYVWQILFKDKVIETGKWVKE